MMMFHAIERISPKGPGQKYVGRCWQCGKTDLTLADAQEECKNPTNMTADQSLMRAIRGAENDHPSHA